MNPAPQTATGGPASPCGLVIKGGITSGVVYAMAILELSSPTTSSASAARRRGNRRRGARPR